MTPDHYRAERIVAGREDFLYLLGQLRHYGVDDSFYLDIEDNVECREYDEYDCLLEGIGISTYIFIDEYVKYLYMFSKRCRGSRFTKVRVHLNRKHINITAFGWVNTLEFVDKDDWNIVIGP